MALSKTLFNCQRASLDYRATTAKRFGPTVGLPPPSGPESWSPERNPSDSQAFPVQPLHRLRRKVWQTPDRKECRRFASDKGLIATGTAHRGSVIHGLAAAAPEIAQRVGKTNAQKLHTLMSSTEFRDLATSAASGDALDRNINRVAGSKAFRDFAKTVGIELKQGRNWLRSAITAGTVQETVAPEPGAPEGAIMVRPQQ